MEERCYIRETRFPMNKHILRFFALTTFALSTQAIAAFESARLDPDNEQPRFPRQLVFEGVADGQIIVAVRISAEGAVSDSLVLAYTHEPFVRACQEAMKSWKITPAKMDGMAVPVQIELKFNFHREGFIETSTSAITRHFLYDGISLPIENQLIKRVHAARELDRVPAVITSVNPAYAKKALDEGVRGRVEVYFYIDEKGEVQFPSVSPGADPYLSDLAVAALKSWRFEAPTRRGTPVMIAASQTFNFGSQ
jgi:TonB family protein